MEPQWNPMAEEQALDRVCRIGQTREVETFRYIIKDSIDEVSKFRSPTWRRLVFTES